MLLLSTFILYFFCISKTHLYIGRCRTCQNKKYETLKSKIRVAIEWELQFTRWSKDHPTQQVPDYKGVTSEAKETVTFYHF